ncbi:MAG: methylmalonyl-CoA mutase family protein [Chloroflexota bacterium]|nr:methylmalonyl-CoA mutase family protein [Dehalococcoidia bacterium]MDW8253803.1 methylmalonyl-CoA mutase family protein [Chloroflexota bacterium]
MAGVERWEREVYEPARRKFPERQREFLTTSGIPIKALYTPEDRHGHDYEQEIGYPGEYPFTRGVQPTMYRARFWTMRQYAGFGTAEESNARYRYLLANGQTGLSVAFDLPTQIGYDSDHPMAISEVGKVGVAISSLEDMEILFRGIPLDQVSTSMTINATASTLLALYIAVAKRQGVPLKKLSGTTQNDILKEYVARGTYIYPPGPSMRLITDMFRYCAEELPLWNTISISGYHMREAGCTAAQEIGFTLAHAIAYVQAALEAGLDIDSFAPRLSFFFVAQSNFFEEVAKFRAARRLWASIMRHRFKAKDPRSWMLRFHTQTAGVSLTAQQPDNNVVRTTIQALAAVLGGTQSLHTNAKDEALALPTEASAQLALRTQQIIAYETGVGDTVDPLGGSYYVETLTDQLEAKAREYIEKIDSLGGAVRAIELGYEQREIQEAAFRLQQEIERGERIVVGVNRFQVPEEIPVPILRVDHRARDEQIARLKRLRATRDQAAVDRALEELRRAAAGTENVMPRILAAVESYATVGEIADTLRSVFGVHKESVVI